MEPGSKVKLIETGEVGIIDAMSDDDPAGVRLYRVDYQDSDGNTSEGWFSANAISPAE